MKIATLESNLRTYTAEEQQALLGNYYDYSSFSIEGYYNGTPYISFDPKKHPDRVSDYMYLMNDYKHLVIKKQSRFQAVPYHVHHWIELNYMYSGSCTLTINDTAIDLHAGQMSLIDIDTLHSISECGENDILINFVIDQNYLDTNYMLQLAQNSFLSSFFIQTLSNRQTHEKFIIFHSENSTRLSMFIEQFLCEYYDNSINSSNILDSLMSLILCELINVFEHDIFRTDHHILDKNVIPIIRYIEKNFKSCTLASTANFFNMHPNYLSAYLKKHTGLTYKKLIQTQRLNLAANMLRETNLPVFDISYHVGYQNTNFFYRKFKEHFSCSPKDFRERAKSQAAVTAAT